MKKFIYAFAGLMIWLLSLTANGQTGTGAIFDTPIEQRDEAWQAKRDSLAKLHGDKRSYSIELECVGDVFTGYNLLIDTLGCHRSYDRYSSNPKDYTLFKIYHTDITLRKVRQVVVLREKWENTPQGFYEGGYKLAAVTQKEYIELNRADAIYGEEWDLCYPRGRKGTDSLPLPNVPGYEIVVLERGYETVERFGSDYLIHTKELATFVDTVQGRRTKFICAAFNKLIGRADYTTENNNEEEAEPSNFIIGEPDVNDYWWRKHFDDIRQQQKRRALLQRMWTASLFTNDKKRRL